MAFDQSGPRRLGISDLIAEPEGPTFISYKVARSRLDQLRFVTQDPHRKLAIPHFGGCHDERTGQELEPRGNAAGTAKTGQGAWRITRLVCCHAGHLGHHGARQSAYL